MSKEMRELTPCEALVKLDRKLSRALNNDAGIAVSAEELRLMAALGIPSIIAESKAKALEEQARCRRLRVVSTNEGHTGSIMSERATGSPPATAGTFGGTTPQQDASNGEARANRMFG